MNDKIKINLHMAGASFPITIRREEEEMVREAAKQVDIRLNAYRERYQNVPLERIMAMVAYQFALENLQQKQRNDTEPYTAKIKELTEELEHYFREQP
ncbi:cell division protein ZapA [uncultured Bacteroides sp.]|uniref:cell division protein ZapA n=1 Tax=uncultured Bacteroides sp. TaxID=162156 RepID=UPI0026322A42|nr:cell division protein ZapA [uncultured Bacteroides sp.]